MTIDAHAYAITIRRGVFEGETLFEGRVRELPDVRAYGDTQDEAYELVVDAIETLADAFADQGRPFPPPLDVPEDYSGRVTLRLPRSLHRALAMTAEEEGVSLNGHLVNLLSQFAAYCSSEGPRASDAAWTEAPQRVAGTRHLRLVASQDLSD